MHIVFSRASRIFPEVSDESGISHKLNVRKYVLETRFQEN